jgi:hypothetical protein
MRHGKGTAVEDMSADLRHDMKERGKDVTLRG